MILLDTNAILWLVTNHKRAKALAKFAGKFLVSPVSVWELAMLEELGRIRIRHAIEDDTRWVIDDPSSRLLFAEAARIGWTRDPFDRLIVAHALIRRLKLATGDSVMIDNLAKSQLVEL